jgi:hypothetical protein
MSYRSRRMIRRYRRKQEARREAWGDFWYGVLVFVLHPVKVMRRLRRVATVELEELA